MRTHPPGTPRPAARRRLRSSVLLLLPVALLVLPASALAAAGPATSPNPTFQMAGGPPRFELASSFLGADVRPFAALGPGLAADYRATPLAFVRWPGGAVADQLNLTSNVIYHDNGTRYVPPGSLAQFAAWCGSVGCRAIVQLPGEIDSPATAAFEVNYIENVVGFRPAYYEIGDEPALWTHFGYPWSEWNTSQHVNATALGYARVVQAYTLAIHRVDPAARIVGLPGVGTGAYGEVSWIHATVRVNGPNLSAVAIHVYPAGPGPDGSASLAQFYGSLGGGGSLASRVPADRAAILAACPTCTQISLLVTELGEGTGGGGYDAFMAGPANVAYVTAELLQGLQLNVTNLDLFALEAAYPGSLFLADLAPTPTGGLFEGLRGQIGTDVLALSGVAAAPGFYLAVTHTPGSSTSSLLVANANATVSRPVELAGSGFPLGRGYVLAWNGTGAVPANVSYSGSVPTSYVVPPGGVLLVVAAPPAAPSVPPLDPELSGLPTISSFPAGFALIGLAFAPAALGGIGGRGWPRRAPPRSQER